MDVLVTSAEYHDRESSFHDLKGSSLIDPFFDPFPDPFRVVVLSILSI